MNTTAKAEICSVNPTSNDQNLDTLRDDELDLVNGGDMLGIALRAYEKWYEVKCLDPIVPGPECR
jgi:hypothetical protein